MDNLRRQFPHLGFALYAFTPRGLVTLEVHDAGHVYTFEGPTAEAAIAAAFPPEPEAPPQPDPPAPNVFD